MIFLKLTDAVIEQSCYEYELMGGGDKKSGREGGHRFISKFL